MRIIKRGRRHIVIVPSGAALEPAETDTARRAKRDPQVVRFDQLPTDLQHALTSPRRKAVQQSSVASRE